VRGLENLEARLTALERKVDKLGGAAKATTTRKSTKATSTKSSGGSTEKTS
jgi:hypothetical protein